MLSPVARWLSPVVAAAAVASGVTVAAVPDGAVSAEVWLATEANPLVGRPFYVDPNSKAARAAKADPSPELEVIAGTPTAYWMDHVSNFAYDAKVIKAAQEAGAMPILALYAIPNRDCGSFAAGGFGSATAYRDWIDRVAGVIGDGPADRLTANPATVVYVDAGHSRWVPAEEMANRLNRVGVHKARGFSVNTANFFTTEEEIGYGEAISGLTGGAHYVVDTSRNGAGPADGELYWCNPPGRALGTPPTTATAGAHADAYLWIKRPGESDGSCGRGEPAAGTFVNQYAIDLVRNAGRA